MKIKFLRKFLNLQYMTHIYLIRAHVAHASIHQVLYRLFTLYELLISSQSSGVISLIILFLLENQHTPDRT